MNVCVDCLLSRHLIVRDLMIFQNTDLLKLGSEYITGNCLLESCCSNVQTFYPRSLGFNTISPCIVLQRQNLVKLWLAGMMWAVLSLGHHPCKLTHPEWGLALSTSERKHSHACSCSTDLCVHVCGGQWAVQSKLVLSFHHVDSRD